MSTIANSKTPFKKGIMLMKEVDLSENFTKRTNTLSLPNSQHKDDEQIGVTDRHSEIKNMRI
jgi:hypothetical protein